MTLLALRWLKWTALLLLGAGTLGGWLASEHDDRQRAVFWLATPGFVLTWVTGYGLARLMGISMGSPWISGSLVASLASLQLLVYAVERPGRSVRVLGGAAALLLVASLGLMTTQAGGTKTAPVEEAHP